jgi:hypothetical protein
MGLRQDLERQISRIDELIELPFDNMSYPVWRVETGQILTEVFGKSDSEPHPCVTAFLAYNVPACFDATRANMQEFYSNILTSQVSLLKMYLDDMTVSSVTDKQ